MGQSTFDYCHKARDIHLFNILNISSIETMRRSFHVTSRGCWGLQDSYCGSLRLLLGESYVLTTLPNSVFISRFFDTPDLFPRVFRGDVPRAYSTISNYERGIDRRVVNDNERVRGKRGFHDYFTSHLPGSSVFPDSVPPKYVNLVSVSSPGFGLALDGTY